MEIDGHGQPHIFAASWPDAAHVLGYLHAGDRLWEMDMFRRQAKGTTAEILGKSGVEHDVLMRGSAFAAPAKKCGTAANCRASFAPSVQLIPPA